MPVTSTVLCLHYVPCIDDRNSDYFSGRPVPDLPVVPARQPIDNSQPTVPPRSRVYTTVTVVHGVIIPSNRASLPITHVVRHAYYCSHRSSRSLFLTPAPSY